MSDVLNGLGTVPLLRAFPNWSTNPKYSFLNSLRIIEYEGTTTDFYEISPRTPQTFNAEMLLETKAQENAFMIFWKARKGSVEKFWIPVFPDLFTLQSELFSGSTSIDIDPVDIDFDAERLFIYTVDDSLVTAKIDSFMNYETKTVLTLAEAIGKDISIEDVSAFGLLILGRFNRESVSLKYETESVIKVQIEVQELLEYSEV